MKYALLFLFALSTPYIHASLEEPAHEVVDKEPIINAIDAAVLNEACRMILNDNDDDELETLFAKYKMQHGKPVKKTSFGIPIEAGRMKVAFGHVDSQIASNSTRKVMQCSWFFDDAPEEIQKIAQTLIVANQQREKNKSWLDVYIGDSWIVKKLAGTQESFYTTLPLPAGTRARLAMHVVGDGKNMYSSIKCTLDLAESDEDKKASLPSRVLTELLEEHVLAKIEAKKFMAEKERELREKG